MDIIASAICICALVCMVYKKRIAWLLFIVFSVLFAYTSMCDARYGYFALGIVQACINACGWWKWRKK